MPSTAFPLSELHGKSSRINDLREKLRQLERGGAGSRAPLPLGLVEIDAVLGGGLPIACLHEVLGRFDDGAAAGFALALLARLLDAARPEQPVLWCGRRIELYGPGLAACGLDPGRFLLVEAPKPADLLWAMEEGLRCAGLAAVVGEIDRLDLTAARRLQLAAEAGGVTGLVLRQSRTAEAGASAATTRWRISAIPGPGTEAGLVTRWHVELLRCRGGRPRDWHVEWCDETGDFALAAAFRDGPAAASATG
jgi:protein ImuA